MDKRILKNSGWIFGAQALVKVISFFYTIFLARSLGVSDFGLLVTALAYFSLISSISDFGFNRFLIREGARNLQSLTEYVSLSALLRLGLLGLTFVIFAVWIKVFDPDALRSSLSILAVLAVLPQSIALTFDAALVARERLKFSALGLLGLSVSTTLLGIYFVTLGFNVAGAITALLIGQIVYALLLFMFLSQAEVKLKLHFSLRDIKDIIKGSLPYGILGVLGLLYFRIDTLLLSYLKGNEETGIYGAAYRFLEAIVFVPSALASAMFPVLAKLHDNNVREIKTLYFSAIKLLGLLSIPIFLCYILVLPSVISLLLPNYLPSIQVIQILSFAIPFMFIHVPGALVLISTEKFLKPVIFLSFFTLAFNIILNFIFIPPFGFIGASVTTVLSEILSFAVFFVLLYFKLLKNA